MRNFFLFSNIYLLLVTACSTLPQNLEGEQWVAFSAEHASQSGLNEWLFPDDVTYWAPNAADIQSVELVTFNSSSTRRQVNSLSYKSMEKHEAI